MKTSLDITTWKRKNHFDFYINFTDPCFNICLNIDVTNAIKFSQKKKQSLFLTLLYLSSKAVNNVPAFKLRLDSNQQVWRYHCIHPSATILREDDTFNFCDFSYMDNIDSFIQHGEESRKLALIDPPLSNVDNQPNTVFYSVIPWLQFTSFKHASTTIGQDIPKIVFGKIHQCGEQSYMPLSIELHHALADGLDMAKYTKLFEEYINELSY